VREFGGAGTAELTICGSRTTLTWRNAAGKVVKSVPAAIRQKHPEELKDLKAAAGDIDKMLPALVQRLDRQFAARRSWTYAAWRERYLDHPLAGPVARQLPAAEHRSTEVPALVLSEVMRDVDLFVGVASLGNDPTWQDGGPNERFAGYWASYSLGELNQAAPRLAVTCSAGCCRAWRSSASCERIRISVRPALWS
jgi:hypothetical protein